MTTVTREALCRSEFCPDPRNPDWHECVVCQAPAVEHAHIVARSRAPGRRKDKNNVVALCHSHHELQTLNKWAFHEEPLPWGGMLHQWLTDERGATVWSRDIGASTAEGEASAGGGHGTGLTKTSFADRGVSQSAAPSSLSAADVSASEAPSEGGGTRPRTPLSPNLADDAGAQDSREFGPTLSPAAATPAPSIAESLKPNGLELPDEFTFDEWADLGGMIGGMVRNKAWWTGDWVLAGERFGERYSQHLEATGYTYESLANCVRVCRRFPRQSGLRHPGLSFAHHAVVYKLDNDAVMEHLIQAADFKWTVAQLRREVHGAKPKTVRFTVEELRERAEGFRCNEHRNHGPRFLAAFLESLE